jgi:hypothetical protein
MDMTVFAELPRETVKWFVWTALLIGILAGVLRRRR